MQNKNNKKEVMQNQNKKNKQEEKHQKLINDLGSKLDIVFEKWKAKGLIGGQK